MLPRHQQLDAGSAYNAADQLTAANSHTCGYDGAGDLTTVDSITRYGYTLDHLLSAAEQRP